MLLPYNKNCLIKHHDHHCFNEKGRFYNIKTTLKIILTHESLNETLHCNITIKHTCEIEVLQISIGL